MPNVIHIVENGSPITLLCLIAFTYYIGKAMLQTHGKLREAGIRIAAAAFVFYLIYGWLTRGASDASTVLSIVWSAVLLFGLILGFVWIALSTGLACLTQLRSQIDCISNFSGQLYYRLQAPQRRRQSALAQQHEREEYERATPERERQREAEELEKNKKAQLTGIRNQKAFEAQLLFSKLQKANQPVFDREEFDKMLKNALTPSDPTMIDHRISMLMEALQARDVPAQEKADFRTIEQIADEYEERRNFVLNCDTYSEEKKQLLVIWLNKEEGHALSQLISRSQ